MLENSGLFEDNLLRVIIESIRGLKKFQNPVA